MINVPRVAPLPPLSWTSGDELQPDDSIIGPPGYDQLVQGAVEQQVVAVEAGMDDIAELVGESFFNRSADRKGSRKALARTLLACETLSDSEAQLADALAGASTHEAILDIMRGAVPGSGIKALCAVLGRAGLSQQRKAYLERALDECLQGPDWALGLFGLLEFGSRVPHELGQLRELYGYATEGAAGLVAWFRKLQKMKDRQRKLRVLVHAFGAELTDDMPDTERARLDAIMQDLKRIILFLGLEEFCSRAAARLGVDGLDGEAMMAVGLEILDDEWLFPEAVSERYHAYAMSLGESIAFVRTLANLFGRLADTCFRDAAHRAQIRETIDVCAQRLADQEMNG